MMVVVGEMQMMVVIGETQMMVVVGEMQMPEPVAVVEGSGESLVAGEGLRKEHSR